MAKASPQQEHRPALRNTGAGARAAAALVVCAAVFWPGWVLAADVVLTIKDHRITPDKVTVAAGERFRIEVMNQDDTPEEFESSDLKIEKIVVPGGKITVMAGPLRPGTYKFFGDYHPDTATGTITAVDRAK